ncbi:MAG: Asp-tRNA(Asn)/Glu-tRNA(Gln) amidotransferase subunit GatB [Acidimicrobiales bacterium]|jgi:aspartyl-tRNA(Asn)/glutamyl-tRNA(Gln) amidotransferase subunit B|nr:Asp-tRNA(Asn)/Glu-tRNA(Gln) amidotransferase subunit GatB [Acidimicrobiales bacterium]MDP6299067.1 Asp-tRNA(Asn)/Glu-tRNA(Gln) amidotransferase subunit GatB [Acidimicrobiales bacterium]HJM28163.1 Asp-tRNA(Asn)/Glu-tRNA(Gln) amidotransferase subunit GatB [Acidimicrobiales bacterium]HJM97576.1 Asp-tRNA(Asn)/Glu-tRNA(Gln) amidotransferase subunit GatB [Acidimicrobiales bacterium]
MSPEIFKENWELVVGLEVHAELATTTKLFCGCLNQFGNEPNTNVCPVCLGLPGSLPVVNEKAVYFAMQLGRALNCTVNRSVFARKNYFYPDMPKDFQISQYDLPTNSDGRLDLPNGITIGIERAHIEEDTGKTTHIGTSGRISGADYSLVDYNRAGVPLIEIVTKPEIHTIDQAKAYVSELRAILLTLGVSDAKMEEGSIRVDANVSIRDIGETNLRTRCEIKNVNSLKSLGRAIDYEANRHIGLYENGESPKQETRHWDENAGRTRSGRSKEDAEDYRYFPEPDLVPLNPSKETITKIDQELPELPAERRKELLDLSGAKPSDIALLVERNHDSFATETITSGGSPNQVIKHLVNNLPDGLGQLTPQTLAQLAQMEEEAKITNTQAKKILEELVEQGGNPSNIAAESGFEAIDTSEVENLVDELITSHSDEWERFCAGEKKVQGFFVGQIMKATSGQADGKLINQILNERSAKK